MPPPHRHRQPALTGTLKNTSPVISIFKLFLITLKSGFRRFHCQCPLSSLLKCALVLSGRRGCGPTATAPDGTETAFSSDDRNSDDNCENVALWEDSCLCQKIVSFCLPPCLIVLWFDSCCAAMILQCFHRGQTLQKCLTQKNVS